MSRGAKRVSGLLLAAVLAVTLFGCNASELLPETPVMDDTNAIDPPPPVLPFSKTEDITDFLLKEILRFQSPSAKNHLCVSRLKPQNMHRPMKR